MVKVAINGFGRIGRLVFRALIEKKNPLLEIVAINDLGSVEMNAYLLKYDSIHGRFPQPFTITDDGITLQGQTIKMTAEPNPEKLPWSTLGVDIVLECSGRFTNKDSALKHIQAGAKKVLISAPADKVDLTVVYGVNHQALTTHHQIVSNASCTTNCLAPLAAILDDAIGIERGYMTTIHAYTGDQRLVDTLHSDPRRSRAAAMSMIPTSTGAAKAVGLVLPKLQGKLDGTAIRVPTANVSVVDLKFDAARKTSTEEINQILQAAAQTPLQEVISVITEPLVSIDFNHSPYSSNIDLTQTQVIDGTFCRVLSWYDNEWGFSNRMVDTATVMGQFI